MGSQMAPLFPLVPPPPLPCLPPLAPPLSSPPLLQDFEQHFSAVGAQPSLRAPGLLSVCGLSLLPPLCLPPPSDAITYPFCRSPPPPTARGQVHSSGFSAVRVCTQGRPVLCFSVIISPVSADFWSGQPAVSPHSQCLHQAWAGWEWAPRWAGLQPGSGLGSINLARLARGSYGRDCCLSWGTLATVLRHP